MIRVQRKRTKGFKMPENTKYVGRPGKFGNPFKLTPDGAIMAYSVHRTNLDPWIFYDPTPNHGLKHILELYERWLNSELSFKTYLPIPPTDEEIKQLKGYNLACFCNLCTPCHADVLIGVVCKMSNDE